MSLLSSITEYNLTQFLGSAGQQITLRNVTVLSGSNPFPNPPLFSNLLVSGTNSQGASSVNLRSNNVNGRFVAGDTLALGTDPTVYTVTAQTQSSGNAFAAVPVTPVLAASHLDGEAAVPSFACDFTVLALVTSFPARLVNGTSIQATDKQVRFLASAINFSPAATDKVFIGSDQYSIVTVKAIQVQNDVYAWACQVRR